MYNKDYNLNKKTLSGRISGIISKKGPWYFFKKSFYIYLYPLYNSIFLKDRTIEIEGQNIKYFSHPFNQTWANERTLEIPLMLDYIKKYSGKRILEIGNVLSHYVQPTWDILDKYEKMDTVLNQDIVEFKPENKYDLIVSISTLEYVGFDEEVKDDQKIIRAIEHIKNNCLNPGGLFIFTVPVGWNPNLDQQILLNKIPLDRAVYFLRTDWKNTWSVDSRERVMKTKFADPYIGANGFVLGIIKQ